MIVWSLEVLAGYTVSKDQANVVSTWVTYCRGHCVIINSKKDESDKWMMTFMFCIRFVTCSQMMIHSYLDNVDVGSSRYRYAYSFSIHTYIRIMLAPKLTSIYLR